VLQLEPGVRGMMTAIRDASVGWDGSDPVRPVVRA